MLIRTQQDLRTCVSSGLAKIADDAVIEMGVELCHPTRRGEQRPISIGNRCHVRSGTIIYSGVEFGAESQTGHHVVIRENTRIGDDTVLGTGVKVEMESVIGDHVLVESQCHLTGYLTIEDYVFLGPACVTANDLRMLHRRAGAGEHLHGPTLRWGCRIGAGCVLLPAVTVGREAVVAAGSVIARDVPDGALAAGNPLRILGLAPEHERVIVDTE